MAARSTALAEALKEELGTRLAKPVLRKYVPYLTSQHIQLTDERITVYPISDAEETLCRSHDANRIVLGIQVAQTLPECGSQNDGNPDAEINNLDFLDARMQTVDDIKGLFRDGGALREEQIGGCQFLELDHPRLYNSEELHQRLFSSIIAITFGYSTDE